MLETRQMSAASKTNAAAAADMIVGAMGADKARGDGLVEAGRVFLADAIKKIISEHEENPLLTLVPTVMEWVEARADGVLSGPEKKKLVLNLLFWVADNADELAIPVLKGHEDEARAFVRNILPTVIDIAATAAKGKLLINAAKTVSRCCPCF